MIDGDLKEFAIRRIEILKERIKMQPNDKTMLQERLYIYEDMLHSFK